MSQQTRCLLRAIASGITGLVSGLSFGAALPELWDKLTHAGVTSPEQVIAALVGVGIGITPAILKAIADCWGGGGGGGGGGQSTGGHGGPNSTTNLINAVGPCLSWQLIASATGLLLIDFVLPLPKGAVAAFAFVAYFVWLVALGMQISDWLNRAGPSEAQRVRVGPRRG